jgi:DNA-binding CsgD family transcriptional regulator
MGLPKPQQLSSRESERVQLVLAGHPASNIARQLASPPAR